MGAMKRNLLFLLALMAVLSLPVRAEITVEELTDAEYLINSGFSQSLAEDVFVQRNRAMGKPIEPLYEKSQNVLVRAWKKFFAYVDPGQESVDKIHHDIKMAPSPSDL